MGFSATTSCARAEPTVGEPNPDDARRARPGADDLRPAARLRPPQPRGHRARERVRRRATSSAPTREAAARSPRCASASPARCRAPARGAAASRPSSSRTSARERLRGAVERGQGVHPRRATSTRSSRASAGAADCPVEAFSIYRGLRTVNPSPYMYFLDFEDFEIAGASPEPLVKVTGRRVPSSGRSPARARARDRRGGPARRRGAARRREGARRARDARRPRPQRPRPRVRVRHASRSTS